MVAGIYLIRNNANGKLYIGSSKDMNARWRNHKSELNRKKHTNSYLQHSWDKYGESSFSFEYLEECIATREILIEREQYYLDSLRPEYNLAKKAENCLGVKHSISTRQKMSEAAKRRQRNPCSEETKAAISQANRGQKRTDEQKERIAKSLRGRSISDDHKSKISTTLKGRMFSEETRAKISESKKGKSLSEDHRKKLSATAKNHWLERKTKK
jgi:group I intron endonuclease